MKPGADTGLANKSAHFLGKEDPSPPPTEETRILLLAPTGQDAKLTAEFLTEAGLEVDVCWEMSQVRDEMLKGCGAVVLAEETLGPDSLPCFMDALKAQPSWSDIPVTIITGGGETVQQRLRKLTTAGSSSNVALLERPFHPETLRSTVEVAIRARRRQYQVRDLLQSQQESEKRTQSILESISDAFVALDADWRFTYINQTFLGMVSPLYRSPGELLGGNLWEKFPDIAGTEMEDFFRRAMSSQKTGVLEYHHASIGRWLEIRAHPTPGILSLYISDITERKLNEEQLGKLKRQVEEQARIFDTTLSYITDFAYTFDRAGRFIYANKPLLDLWGLTLEQAAGKNFHDLNYDPDLADRLQRQIQEVFHSGKVIRDETSYTNPEGETGYYEYIFSPVFDANGVVEIVAGSTRIITGRKQAEEEIRAARARLEATLFAAEIGTWTWDMQADQVMLDQNLARLVFLPPGDHLGTMQMFLNTIHVEDRPRVEVEIGAAIKSETGDFASDYRVTGPEGAFRWVTARGRVQRDERGVPVSFPGVVIDITERKRQEQALADLSLRIEDQARLFDATLSHISDLAYTFDREGRVIYANKPLLDLWGKSLEESTGRTLFELGYPRDLATRLHAQFMEVISTGKAIHGEVNFTSASGVEDCHEYIYNPVFAQDGSTVAIAGTSRLITQRKRDVAMLREAKEAAEAANRAKDRFLAVLSHELRTPLTPVLMTVASMEVDPSFPVETRESFSMIRRNVELETKLIDDLLDLSRVASGKLVLHPETVDLNGAIRHVCSICGPQFSEKEVHLHCNLAEDAGFVRADPARFRQVLWNLFNNAVKFTPAKKNIHVTTALSGAGLVRVEVRDEGIGIPAAAIPRIFDAFEQGEEKITRQFGGLGLGLAICKALVELHHGTIRAESNGEGQGATFIMEFPSETTLRSPAAPATPGAETASARKLSLLIVEDHVDTAASLTRLLQRSGYLVETAVTVKAAVALAKAGAFDLVISDLGLPDATGYELMRRLREHGNIKGIAMSGYGMDEDVRKSREAGFSEHLVKPVNVTYLREAIRRVTGQCD